MSEARKYKVLLIDDDELIRATIGDALGVYGFDVDFASDGDAGITAAVANTPDVILTDVIMPGKEGIETITELKQKVPGVKIIAMSGGGSTQNMTFLEMAKKVGADKTLSKPFGLKQLVTEIKSLMAD